MRANSKSDIPKEYGLASSYTAAEFIEEDVYYYMELVPFDIGKVIYFHDESSEKYKYQLWLPNSIIIEINRKIEKLKEERKEETMKTGISIKEYEDTISTTKFIDENYKSLYYCVIGCGKTFTLDEASEDRCPHCLSSRIAPYMR